MKFASLILAVVCAVGISSCCCQSQPMPKLRPFPKDCKQIPDVAPQPEAPVKVLDCKGK